MRTGRLHIAIYARKFCYTCTQGFECCHTLDARENCCAQGEEMLLQIVVSVL